MGQFNFLGCPPFSTKNFFQYHVRAPMWATQPIALPCNTSMSCLHAPPSICLPACLEVNSSADHVHVERRCCDHPFVQVKPSWTTGAYNLTDGAVCLLYALRRTLIRHTQQQRLGGKTVCELPKKTEESIAGIAEVFLDVCAEFQEYISKV